MFEKIFEKLGESYNKERKLLKEKNIYDAYVMLKKREEAAAAFLSGLLLIIMKKRKQGVEIINSNLEIGKELLGEDLLYEIIGTVYFDEENYLEASRYFLKSIECNPSNFISRYNLANIYILRKDYKKSYEILKQLHLEEPENKAVKHNLELLKSKL